MDDQNLNNPVAHLVWGTWMDVADLQAYAEKGIFFECSRGKIVFIGCEGMENEDSNKY